MLEYKDVPKGKSGSEITIGYIKGVPFWSIKGKSYQPNIKKGTSLMYPIVIKSESNYL